jgi:hypothetical protein
MDRRAARMCRDLVCEAGFSGSRLARDKKRSAVAGERTLQTGV